MHCGSECIHSLVHCGGIYIYFCYVEVPVSIPLCSVEVSIPCVFLEATTYCALWKYSLMFVFTINFCVFCEAFKHIFVHCGSIHIPVQC